MYIPSKRHRFGFKIYVLCDCKSGYILDIILYTGEQTEIGDTSSLGVAGATVVEMMERYLGRGHALYTDNFYTSPLLSEELLKYDTYLCGTTRRNRKHMPKLKEPLARKEVIFVQEKSKKVMVSTWQDKREVNMLTTAHNPIVKKVGGNKRKRTGAVWKPEAVIDYNVNMRLVDKSDGMIASIECARKTQKWYKKLFFHLVDMVVYNTFILYREVTLSNFSLPAFAQELVRQLIAEHGSRPLREDQDQDIVCSRLSGTKAGHFPVEHEDKKYRRCHFCAHNSNGKSRKESRIFCRACKKTLCVTPCFEMYHTQEAIKCKCCKNIQKENIPPV